MGQRFEFMPVFRIGIFHLRMNKTIQDLESGMPLLVNIEDELSLGYFRTSLGLRESSNSVTRLGCFYVTAILG